MANSKKLPSSFRDPSGFLFYRDGSIYRQVNRIYKDNYDQLIDSGLYKDLVDAELLIPHTEVNIDSMESDKAYKIIKPEKINFIAYPYELCFSQLKDAALATLEIQKKALAFGMSLKDCSAYNIQFNEGKPILIDTLSFEKYNEEKPWVAYKQFCQHFFAPLSLMSYKDIRLNQLFRIYIDGIPIDLASSLLPFRTHLKFSTITHIHLHAKSQKHYSDKIVQKRKVKISLNSFNGLIDNLESSIKKLKWKPAGTEWAEYYSNTNYTSKSLEHKKHIILKLLKRINPKNVWDLGANDGSFSRIASNIGIPTISFDIDPSAIERSYLKCKKNIEKNIQPLLLDLTNPSSGIGWANQERESLSERGPADMVFALALVHHLAISNNLPFEMIADYFYSICNSIIIEFVPKDDSKVQKLLYTREDIFPNYNQEYFEKCFIKYFKILTCDKIDSSKRLLYLMVKRDP